MKLKGYIFDCKLKNGKKGLEIGYGFNVKNAIEVILNTCEHVEKVLPTYIIIKPEEISHAYQV